MLCCTLSRGRGPALLNPGAQADHHEIHDHVVPLGRLHHRRPCRQLRQRGGGPVVDRPHVPLA
eukprot:9687073-Alexandrium_andersonii.AAC.1